MSTDAFSAESDNLPGQACETANGARAPQQFDRTDWLSFCAATVSALTVYLLTLASDVTLEDSGVFATGAMYGGVPMASGYPLWTIYAWTFAKLLPVSNIAWRTALSSAVAGAVACGLIALMVSHGGTAMVVKRRGLPPLKPGELTSLRVVCGFVAGLVFGCNGAFWSTAVVAAAWALSILMLCFVLCLLQRWRGAPEQRRYLYGAFFVYGLTLTNSHLMLAAAPAIPVLVALGDRKVGRDLLLVGGLLLLAGLAGVFMEWLPFWIDRDQFIFSLGWLCLLFGLITTALGVVLAIKTRRLFTEWKATLACGACLVLGLGLYFYVPVASMTNPPMNWGYPRTVQGFYHVLSRGQYERIHLTESPTRFLKQMRMYAAVAGKEFGWPFLFAALIPFGFLRRMAAQERRVLLGLSAVFLCLAILFLVVLNPGTDRQSLELLKVYFSASYVVLAIWLGQGLTLLGAKLMKPTSTSPLSGQV